eukprot:2845265-Alexandrium_andersonii.AAC.2
MPTPMLAPRAAPDGSGGAAHSASAPCRGRHQAGRPEARHTRRGPSRSDGRAADRQPVWILSLIHI